MTDGGNRAAGSQDADWRLSFEERAALKKIKSCAIAALVSAVLTFGWAVASLMVSAEAKAGKFGYMLDPWMFLDGALILGLAAAIYFKKSYSAALFLLIYFLSSKLIIAAETMSIQSGVISLVFIYFYLQGVIGTRELRNLRDSFPVKRGAGAIALRFLAGVGLALFLLAAGWGTLMSMKVLPDSVMIEGNDIPQRYAVKLRQQGILAEGELIEVFYSSGLLSILEDGNLMTDRRVISYEESEDEMLVLSATFEEVSHILIAEDGATFRDALLEVVSKDGSSFYLYMTVEDQAHLRFMDELRRKIAVLE